MKTLRRLCLEDTKFTDGDKSLVLKRGVEYLTSESKAGKVTVFSTYWVPNVSVNLFAGESPPQKD